MCFKIFDRKMLTHDAFRVIRLWSPTLSGLHLFHYTYTCLCQIMHGPAPKTAQGVFPTFCSTSTHLLCCHARALPAVRQLFTVTFLFIYFLPACVHIQWCALHLNTLSCASCNLYYAKTNPKQRKPRAHQHISISSHRLL